SRGPTARAPAWASWCKASLPSPSSTNWAPPSTNKSSCGPPWPASGSARSASASPAAAPTWRPCALTRAPTAMSWSSPGRSCGSLTAPPPASSCLPGAPGELAGAGRLCSDTSELFFDDCRIPARYILGEKNRGFYYIMQNFQGERLASAIMMVASMARCLDLAIQYGKERSAFGNPVGSYQVWRHKFAEHRTKVEAARWLVYRALDLTNRGQKADRKSTRL